MNYHLRIWPDPILREPTEKVTVFDDQLQQFLDEMTLIMHREDGVGLAAPQIGELRKIAVVYDAHKEEIYHLINPEIVENNGSQIGDEGCLSFPGIFGKVKRPMALTVAYQNAKGENCKIKVEGFLARAFAHEIDHLNGRLFIDNFSPLKREMLLKKMGQA